MRNQLLNVLVAVSLLGWAGYAKAQETTVRLTQSDGTVEIRKGEQPWRPAKEGDILGQGDRLRTAEKSGALLIWSNGSMVKVYPEAELMLAGVTFDLERKMEKTVLDLEKGRLFVKAQVPENLFADFKVRMGSLNLRAQGAEYGVKYDPAATSATAWSLLGRLVSDVGTERIRIDDGQQGILRANAKPDVTLTPDNIQQSLKKVSKDLGGSLLAEEESATTGGKLTVKIGGVKGRRGNTPYAVNFKARVSGGSGKIKSITWDFGDGESSPTKEAEHTFTQGVYVVILRVEDQNGEKASAQIGISVEADCGC